jgi:hypothetical protein
VLLYGIFSKKLMMKRYLLLVLLFSTIVTFGQHKSFRIGFKAGLNVGWFAADTEGYSNNGAKVGGSYGLVIDIFLVENFFFTTGIDFVYLNGSFTKPAKNQISSDIITDVKAGYIEVPLIFTLRSKKINDKFRIYGQFGLGVSFLLRANAEEQFTASDGQKITLNKNVYNEMTATRESLILGTGVELPLFGSAIARFGIRFDNCFINILKGNDGKARNNFFEINLAVLF